MFGFSEASPGTWHRSDPQRPVSTDPHAQHIGRLDVAYRETSAERRVDRAPPCTACQNTSEDVQGRVRIGDSPLVASSSMGCLKRVMSLKVQRKRTTLSFSFLIGAICM